MTTAQVPRPEVEAFVANLPQFSIDGQPMSLPAVAFARKRYHTVFYPINC